MNKYVIRYSDKYKKVTLFKIILETEHLDEIYPISKHILKYKNETVNVNIMFNRTYGSKLEVIRQWINERDLNLSKSARVFFRYLCWFYPEELL